jgi:hypothetical protein
MGVGGIAPNTFITTAPDVNGYLHALVALPPEKERAVGTQ